MTLFGRRWSSFAVRGSDIFVSYCPWFRAETERQDRPVSRSFRIRALPSLSGAGIPLCPARALRS